MAVCNPKPKTTSTAKASMPKAGSSTLKGKPKATHRVTWRGKQITEFEMKVYETILAIPAGKVSTYGAVARVLHSGPRCVGQALRKNPFAPEVPCHRVVTTSLGIGGFQGTSGEESPCVQKKRMLLAQEGVLFASERKVAAWHALRCKMSTVTTLALTVLMMCYVHG